MTEFQRELITVAELNEKTRGIVSELSSITLERLATYMLERNKTLNLTAIKDESGIILKHLVDSSAVSLEEYIPRGARVIDIGCGGGFPSLVIATLRRDVSVLGVDSVTKKVNYVNDAGKFLGLNNISVTNKRAEELERSIIVIRKTKSTPQKYPRNNSQIAKKPL